ncbi:hypothetical protein SAMN05661044_03009 [Olivibacter domesticus]|uniref:Uncharacterized protein n=1 Tax=Olivibacter domesticus TaxID=407022 RepID=A0A1H7RZK6_OLID1|nr:hypothetical protein SAMN05661044_03009 [Olivibacter domesticus]
MSWAFLLSMNFGTVNAISYLNLVHLFNPLNGTQIHRIYPINVDWIYIQSLFRV